MASNDGLRIAFVAERKGWVFPRFSEDEVTQFCIEEALMARVDVAQMLAEKERLDSESVAAAQEQVRLTMEMGA